MIHCVGLYFFFHMGTLASAFGGAKAAEKMTFELNDALQNLANVKMRIVERIEAERAKQATEGKS